MMKITDVFVNEKITKENASEKLKEVYEITSMVDKYIKERDAKNDPTSGSKPTGLRPVAQPRVGVKNYERDTD